MSKINKDTQVKDQPWGSYWDNEGKYQQEYDAAWKALIPASGEAGDGLPEALRAISRVGYDYYNNGFCNLWREWEDVDDWGGDTIVRKMDSYYEDLVDYLAYHVPSKLYDEFKDWLPTISYGSISWGANGDDVIDRIIDHIIEQMIHEQLIAKA
tara:strand:- start:90 stop:551 length:462 start_codon:yes stop_codon:yes gene_type:complete